MRIIRRDWLILKNKSKSIFLTMGLYLFLIMLLSLGSIDGITPVEMLFESAFNDNGPIIDFRRFIFPVSFIVIHFFPIYVISEILYKDHMIMGTYTISKFESKRTYLLSKVVVSSLYNALIGFFFFMVLIFFVKVQGENQINLLKGLVRIGIFYILENIVITNFVIVISFFTNFRLGMLYLFLNLIGSILTNNRAFIGQASLVMKQDFYGGNFSILGNFTFIIIYFFILAGILYHCPKNLNYYGRKND